MLILVQRVRQIDTQYRVRTWLESVGGFVKYEGGGNLKTPGYLLKWANNEPVFDRINAVGITTGSPPIDREGLRLLAKLKGLKSACFHVCDFDDNDLAVLSECNSLEEISLPTSSVTDAGLIHLQGKTNLKKLNFLWCDVSEKALRDLTYSLPELQEMVGIVPKKMENSSASEKEARP